MRSLFDTLVNPPFVHTIHRHEGPRRSLVADVCTTDIFVY